MIVTVAKWVLIILLVLFFVREGQKYYRIGYSVFSPTAMDAEGSGKDVEVTITKDMSVKDIGALLEKDGLIQNGSVFYYQELFSAYHGKLMPGTYTLNSSMLPDEMMKTMSADYADTAATGESASEAGSSLTSDTASSDASAAGDSILPADNAPAAGDGTAADGAQ
jgi:UPF0755 protein